MKEDKYYNNIKDLLIENETTKLVKSYSINKSDLTTYYNVGKELSLAGKHYGEGIIKRYSKELTMELGKGCSERNLRNMRQFYKLTKKWQTLSAKLNWSIYCEIMWFEEEKFLYYVTLCLECNLSVRELRQRIKSNVYERLDESTKLKLTNKHMENVIDENVVDYIKDPILIKNKNNYENISEKLLQKLILEDLNNFLEELGSGFSFVKNEYKIKLGDTYNYIDLLLYNFKFKCFVVVELKVTKLTSNHTGQIQNYMNYIDENVKDLTDNKTVGIIICKENNEYVIKYCSDKRVISREYKII